MERHLPMLLLLALGGSAALHAGGSRMPRPRMAVAAEPLAAQTPEPRVAFSGLNGQALAITAEDVPTRQQFKAAIPKHCFSRDTGRSLGCLAQSLLCTAPCVAAGFLLPLKLAALPLWIAYATVTGTAAMGLWVLGHECGHGAFSDNSLLQTVVGYALHSAFLVPYFSWQRSHAVHHAHTNHITNGETHVPVVLEAEQGKELPGGEESMALAASLPKSIFGSLQLFLHGLIGWPAYLLFGATGGPNAANGRGFGANALGANHFWPAKPFSTVLWPGQWARKVWLSDIGVGAVLGLLGLWASKAGLATVAAIYGGPYLVVNAWLVAITWLQHTDVDVPHLPAENFSFMRGAFLSIDRPYGRFINWLHHNIGSTHAVHHIDCTVPHYHAIEATAAVAKAFPKAYLYDPTPIHKALWRVATGCIAVRRSEDGSRYTWVPAYN